MAAWPEELVHDTVTTGAESDLQQLTQIVRSMVGRWGMSEGLGLATLLVGRRPGTVYDAYAAAGVAQASEPLSRTERVSIPVA